MSAVASSRLGWAVVAVGLVGLAAAAAPVRPAAAPNPNGQGFLGVQFVQAGDSLAVDSVTDGLPAARAGVRPGDVLVRVNSLRPTGTQEMIDRIKSYRPGATVELEVQRGAERKTFKVTLGARPPELDRAYQVLPVIPGQPFRP